MSIISALIQPVTDILDKVIPDADTKQRIAHEIATQVHTIAQAQIEVNKTEAKHKDLFVAGWRPAVGWTCCLGMAGNFLVIPMANFTLALSGSAIAVQIGRAHV